MMNSYQTLQITPISDEVIHIALNRADAANAINTQMGRDIQAAFSEHGQYPCRAVILSGLGKHFCAGADLKERKDMSKSQWHEQHGALENAQEAVAHCAVPVIAAVQGAAYGGGLELALACDFIYAAKNARFALTETTLGIIPGMGGTQRLPRRIGIARAKELIYLGKPFSADQALEWGVVNHLHDETSLLDEAIGCAKHIADNAPLAVRAAKKAIDVGIDHALHEALALELQHYNTLLETKDRHEGINAFNEKRKANFRAE